MGVQKRRKQRNQRTQMRGDHGGFAARFLKHHTTSRSFRSRNYVHARCLDSSTFQVAVSGHTPATKQGGGYSSARTLFGHHSFFTCRESLPHRAFLWPHRLLSRPPSLEPLKGMWTPSQGFQRRTWQTLNPQDWEESSRKPGFGSQPARVQWLEVFFGFTLWLWLT